MTAATPEPDPHARIAGLSPARRALLDRLLADGAGKDAHLPRNPVERTLAAVWQRVLRVDSVGVHDSFLELGGDSIASLQVSVKALAEGLRVSPRQVIEADTVAELALLATEVADDEAAASDERSGTAALTPVQRWFFAQDLPDPHHWNQLLFVEVHGELDETSLDRALRALTDHHDVLRSRFVCGTDGWAQEVPGEATAVASRVSHLEHLTSAEQDKRVRAVATEAQQEIDLRHGPLVSAVLFRLGAHRPDRLLVAVHHLVVDGVSMRILLEDLETACGQLADGSTEVVLPATATSWVTWSHALARHAHSRAVLDELDHWRQAHRPGSAVAALRGTPAGAEPDTVGDSATVTAEIPAAVLRGRAPHGLRELLLAAFLLAWRDHTGHAGLQLDLEGHGREPLGEPVDVARTVGWFTSIYPVVLTLPDGSGPATAPEAVRRQLRDVPANGVGYGLLRYLNEDTAAQLACLPPSEVSLNYLGWFDRPAGAGSVFGPPLPAPCPARSTTTPRPYALDVVITGVEDRLTVEFTYGRRVLPADRVEGLATAFVMAMAEVAGATDTGAREFPSMRLDGGAMSAITRQIGIHR
jgi:non-ribosomal peptide synthase protein (TIGR01720 family)